MRPAAGTEHDFLDRAGQIVEIGAFGVQTEVEQLKRDKLLLLKEVMRLRNQQLETAGAYA